LIYTPAQLAVKPKYDGTVEIKIDERGASHGWCSICKVTFISLKLMPIMVHNKSLIYGNKDIIFKNWYYIHFK
jgi:hypothetical protein